MTDEDYMSRAIELARARVGLTGDNPAVGCVIVRDGRIVGEGVTGEGGRPHGEEVALAQAGDLARGATAYVTLEPCGQRSGGGRSCSELLAAAGVVRVAVGADDASVFADGQGVQRLRSAGVCINQGLMREEADTLYAAYRPAKGLESRR